MYAVIIEFVECKSKLVYDYARTRKKAEQLVMECHGPGFGREFNVYIREEKRDVKGKHINHGGTKKKRKKVENL